MVLSDRDIKLNLKSGKIKIEPCDIDVQVSPVGVDLRLGNAFRLFKTTHRSHIDLAHQNLELDTDLMEVEDGGEFMLHPGEFVLGITKETIELPNDIAGRIDGRSSLGRLGIIVHSTAGHVDPGWKGKITLEISNIGKLPIAIIPGMRFCNIMFEPVSSPVENAYKGKYAGTDNPLASKISEEFKGKPEKQKEIG
ncbi:MAG: dCTP deaminase [Candidatus Micrarchaeaceae archaeon]|jgi:dCTP deaminase